MILSDAQKSINGLVSKLGYMAGISATWFDERHDGRIILMKVITFLKSARLLFADCRLQALIDQSANGSAWHLQYKIDNNNKYVLCQEIKS